MPGEAGQVVLQDAAIEPGQVADALLQDMAAGRFLILPHPQVHGDYGLRAGDTGKRLRGMNRMQQRIEEMERGMRLGHGRYANSASRRTCRRWPRCQIPNPGPTSCWCGCSGSRRTDWHTRWMPTRCLPSQLRPDTRGGDRGR